MRTRIPYSARPRRVTTNRRIALALAGVVCAACVEQSPVSPNAPTLVVHAVLDGAAAAQFVVVQYTDGLLSHQRAVTGAVVTITAPDGHVFTGTETLDTTVVAASKDVPQVGTVYRVALGQEGTTLVPGGTYTLRVATPSGSAAVTGRTTIPFATSSVPEMPGSLAFDRVRDTLALAWSPIPSTAAYEVSVKAFDGDLYMTFADTALALPGMLLHGTGRAVFKSGLRHQVVVSAVDVNYYDYFRRGSNTLTGLGPINHLSGGVGVFGSMARVKSMALDVR